MTTSKEKKRAIMKQSLLLRTLSAEVDEARGVWVQSPFPKSTLSEQQAMARWARVFRRHSNDLIPE